MATPDWNSKPFSVFCSKSNQAACRCKCRWEPCAGAWKCKYWDPYGGATIVGGPLGPGILLYFDPPIDDQGQEGPFANGTRALKGHSWICGQHA